MQNFIESGDAPQNTQPANNPLAESLSGANNPLIKQASDAAASKQAAQKPAVNESKPASSSSPTSANDFTGASEVITDASGKTTEVPLSQDKLAPGDHTIEFQNGRQFIVHVPPNDGKTEMPVMFVISPSVEASTKDASGKDYDAKNFETETGMNQYADQDKFVTVYALPEKHKLGAASLKPAEAWNAPGSGIDSTDLKKAGYNDENYIKAIAGMMPQLANVDASHKDWGAIAFSQGGLFLNQLSHDVPNLFPSVGLVGSSMETNYNYSTAAGNAQNVLIENLDNDKQTMPFPGKTNLKYKGEELLVDGLNHDTASLAADAVNKIFSTDQSRDNLPAGDGLSLAEMLDPLGAIDNRDQDPRLQEQLYTKDIESKGPYTQQTVPLPTPNDSSAKDTETIINSKNSNGSLDIVDLPQAQHSYPGPDHGTRVNATPQYVEFNTSQFFSQMFEQYNQKVDNSQKSQ